MPILSLTYVATKKNNPISAKRVKIQFECIFSINRGDCFRRDISGFQLSLE